jgi:hypothetical protein
MPPSRSSFAPPLSPKQDLDTGKGAGTAAERILAEEEAKQKADAAASGERQDTQPSLSCPSSPAARHLSSLDLY